MEEVPYWFWMIIVTGLAGMLGLIMYYTAMLLRETTSTVHEFKYVMMEMHDVIDGLKGLLERLNRIADKASATVETVLSTIDTISNSIVKPVVAIGATLSSVKAIVERYVGRKRGDLEEAIEED